MDFLLQVLPFRGQNHLLLLLSLLLALFLPLFLLLLLFLYVCRCKPPPLLRGTVCNLCLLGFRGVPLPLQGRPAKLPLGVTGPALPGCRTRGWVSLGWGRVLLVVRGDGIWGAGVPVLWLCLWAPPHRLVP